MTCLFKRLFVYLKSLFAHIILK